MISRRTSREEEPLVEAVRELREELRVMRDVVSELVEALQWQINNADDYPTLVHGRWALWSLAEARLPRLIENINFGPPIPSSQEPINPRSQRELF